MAQLKDDCFAFGGELMPLEAALKILKTRIEPVTDTQCVTLRAGLGRILAEDITSPRDVPPHDNAAVDGYAVFFDDLDGVGETRLPVTGRVAAGHPLDRPARRGEAIRIFTGAPVPAGMDTIFMEEDCRVEDADVLLPNGLKRGANRRFRAEDVSAGAIIIRSGSRLRAQEIGLAASIGRAELKVFSKLRAAVFSTGDEIFDPSGDAPEGCVYDANRFSVMGLLEGLGCQVTDIGILPDDRATITKALGEAAVGHDILVTSGGISAGEEDHVKAAVEAQGGIHFWRLAIKPGRPVALGQVGGTAFVGLPGNPVAAMVTFMMLARPVALLLGGATEISAPRFPVTAGFAYKKKTGRREWLRATLQRGDDGDLTALKYPAGGSGILTSMVAADGLVELGEDRGAVAVGERVDFLPFSEVS